MREKELRRSLSVLPMGVVIKLTGLTARQIRYYEARHLIAPQRSKGNRRLYSLNDVDRLLDIKDDLNAGLDIAGIQRRDRQAARRKAEQSQKFLHQQMSDGEARHLLKNELLNMGGVEANSPAHHNYPI